MSLYIIITGGSCLEDFAYFMVQAIFQRGHFLLRKKLLLTVVVVAQVFKYSTWEEEAADRSL